MFEIYHGGITYPLQAGETFDFTTIDVAGITHINYAFVNIREGEVVFDTTKIDGKNQTPKAPF